MSDDTHRIGNALIVNTHGLMKMRCRRPMSSRLRHALFVGPRFGLGERANARRDRRVADERQPAAVAVERLERLEAEEAGVAERADRASVPGRAQRVRAVLDHEQLVARGDVEDGPHVAREAVEVRRHDGAGGRRDGALERLGGQRERRRIDVGEHHLQARDPGERRDDPERQRRQDDLGALRQVERFQDVVERHPAVRRGHGVRRVHPGAPGERGFELRNLGTLDELAAGLAARDDVV